MGRRRNSLDNHGNLNPGNGARSHRRGTASATPTLDKIAIFTLAAVVIAAALLGWWLSGKVSALHRATDQTHAATVALNAAIGRVEATDRGTAADVATLPHRIPPPKIAVFEQPGRTVVVITSPMPSPRPSPSPSPTPTPTPPPTPGPSPTCLPTNPPVCLGS